MCEVLRLFHDTEYTKFKRTIHKTLASTCRAPVTIYVISDRPRPLAEDQQRPMWLAQTSFHVSHEVWLQVLLSGSILFKINAIVAINNAKVISIQDNQVWSGTFTPLLQTSSLERYSTVYLPNRIKAHRVYDFLYLQNLLWGLESQGRRVSMPSCIT